MVMTTPTVRLRRPHHWQNEFISSPAPRKIIRAGRRGGKTTGVAILAVQAFMQGARVLYGSPTQDQVSAFWWEVKKALAETLDAGLFYKNESLKVIERIGTKQRLRAKTCWNSDTLRGDTADLLILDEWQLMDENTWDLVGGPMLLDNNGDAVFIYTPPSLHSRSTSKARDPQHAAKMFKTAQADESGRWQAFHFTSHDNPHISAQALQDLAQDMTTLAYRQEIEAEDVDEAPGALWKRQDIDAARVTTAPDLERLVIGVDPPGGSTECGIVAVGKAADGDLYVMADRSLQASPDQWGEAVVYLYDDLKADRILGERNYGGDMVEHVIRTAADNHNISVTFALVNATRGKAIRAEPISAKYEQGHVHHVGNFPQLEDEMCLWVPGESTRSPNRIDAMVWAATQLTQRGEPRVAMVSA